jgi:DNA-binding phage protein
MVKTRILLKQKKSSENTASKRVRNEHKIMEFSPSKELLDEKLIAQGIWECLKNNDPEGVIEIIQIHLEAHNKSQFAEDAEIARSTMYNAFKSRNPQLRTLAKLIHAYHM